MPFIFQNTPIDGLVVIEPKAFPDDRGFFLESYKKSEFENQGIPTSFVQDNHSNSSKGTMRALHYQLSPYCQGKLVRVTRGSVWDVAVDLRKESQSYGKWFGLELSAENHTMFWIPEGFAHGFVALTDEVDFLYKTTNEYHKESERSIIWNDPDLAIKWPIDKPLLSEKDSKNPRFLEIPAEERML